MTGKKKSFTLPCWVVAVMLAAGGCTHNPRLNRRPHISALVRSPAMTLQGITGKEATLGIEPGRIYVRGDGYVQRGARLLANVGGLEPGTRVYWSIEYKKGPLHRPDHPPGPRFSPRSGHAYNPLDRSSRANKNGEAEVLFTGTTYAGDSFRLGVGFENIPEPGQRFKHAVLMTRPLVVWKRVYLEAPKILKGVRFPGSTWSIVKANLARLNIEVHIRNSAIDLNAAFPGLEKYFTGLPGDRRYGPQGVWDRGTLLKMISLRTSDGEPETINLVVLGASSRKTDMIGEEGSGEKPPPQPVDYNYLYEKGDIDPWEFRGYGTAAALIGDSPAVFIWSDYWWVLSQTLKISHDRVLARVALHEIGHHLLRRVRDPGQGVLDIDGHLKDELTGERTIMKGCRLTLTCKNGRYEFSRLSVKEERRFLKNPTWHPEIEYLVRRNYIPLKH